MALSITWELFFVKLEANVKLGEIFLLLLLLFPVFPVGPYQTIHRTALSINGLNIQHNSLIMEPLLIKFVQILQFCNYLRNIMMILMWTTSIDAIMKSELSQTVDLLRYVITISKL